MEALIHRRFDLNEYVIFSTVACLFLQQKIIQGGADIFLGYPIVVLNTLLLLATNRLYVHPRHILALAGLTLFSLLAAHYAKTPANAITSQILGITLMSIYYFGVITSSKLSLADWMEIYARFAFGIAVLGLLLFPLQRFESSGESDRLHSIFVEPSFYVNLTLPAIGWYVNNWLSTRRYGWDILVFGFTYILADSSLGFLGLILIGIFVATSRLGFWKAVGASITGLGAVGILLLMSSNFRLRVYDTLFAVYSADVSKTNLSTFAFLSNAYVVGQTFMAHPILGVGIGGYQYQYQHYIGDLSGIPKDFLDLQVNMYDASSLFLRALAELGIAGPLTLLSFLIICAQVRSIRFLQIRNALLPYFIIRVGRYGSYFSLEFFFFIAIYLLNYREYRSCRRESRLIAREAPNGI
jgi:hypothetical protein